MTYSFCPVCNKARSKGNHDKCSRKLQAKYAPGTELHSIQEANRLAEKAERQAYVDKPQGKKAAYHMKVGVNSQ